MRLDGFSYLHLFEMDDLRAVFWALADIDPSEVETVAVKLNAKLRSALEEARSKGLSFPFPELPDVSELAVKEYFEAAKRATLKELLPIAGVGYN
jgi:hypothetical protein